MGLLMSLLLDLLKHSLTFDEDLRLKLIPNGMSFFIFRA